MLLDEDDARRADRRAAAASAATAFDGFPCLANGKADAQIMCVDPGPAPIPTSTLLTNANVERLEPTRPAAGDRGRRHARRRLGGRYSGDIVVVACGALNSALLLLRSANDAHPNGLANGSDQVGPQLHAPQQLGLDGAVEGAQPDTVFQKTLALNDFYFKGEDWEFPLGGIQMLGKADGEQLRGKAPHFLAWAPS